MYICMVMKWQHYKIILLLDFPIVLDTLVGIT